MSFAEKVRKILYGVAFVVLLNDGDVGVEGVRYVPHSPCPDKFGYFESETFEVFGAWTYDNDLSGQYDLEVNMSIATVTDKNISIRRRTPEYKIQNGAGIEYYVFFPYNHTFPKVTSITFNGKLICVGPPEEANAEHGVTALSAKNSLTTKILDSLKTTTTTTTTARPPVIQITINNKVKNEPDCGTNIDYKPLVFGGESTRSGEYPWLVAIFVVEGIGGYAFQCGGSLVSTKHVITAGHCMRDILGTSVASEDLVVVLGKHNIKNWARGSTIRSVREYYVHPEYRKPADADIAVLLLDDPVTYSVTIKPICIWDEIDRLEDLVSRNGTVAGWGKDENGKRYVEEPKQIQLPIVSQETCLRSDTRYLKLTSTRTFCAGNVKEHRGPCSGDSGSGLVINREGKWKLRGIVSIALLDPDTLICDVNNYIVFSDVPKYIPWLQKVMDTP